MPGNILSQLSSLNQKLTLNQKLSIIGLSTVILFGILSFVFLLQRDSYQLLYSNLDASNASAITEKLKQMNIPYQLSDGGRSILIPPDRINEARIEIASQGLPSTGRIGFEIFDKSGWGITDFAEKVNYRRALEGELERTIMALSELSQARVHLVLEKESLFEQDRKPAKASVVIQLRTGTRLPPSRVQGIQNLVAFAVEGLDPANVTVVDVHGNLLSQPEQEETHLSTAQLDLRRKMERDLEQKVVSILEPLVGKDRVRVTAAIQLDYSETEQTEQIVDPDKSAILSQQRTEEAVNGMPQRGGIPFRANDGEAVTTQGNTAGRTLLNEAVNYEVSKTVKQTRLPRGSIKQQSVAVVVDDRLVRTKNDQGEVEESLQSRTPEEMEQLRNLVSATMGFVAERGDTLTVENLSFIGLDAPPRTEVEPSFLDRNRPLVERVLRYLLILLLFVLFYFMIFRPVKKKVFSYVEFTDPEYAQLAAATQNPELVHRLEEKMARLGDPNRRALGEGQKPGDVMEEKAIIKKQLVSLAESDPNLVTQLVRSWLSEGA